MIFRQSLALIALAVLVLPASQTRAHDDDEVEDGYHAACATKTPPEVRTRRDESVLVDRHRDLNHVNYTIPVHFTVLIAADGWRGNNITNEQIEGNLIANLNHGFRDSPFTFELGGVKRATPNDNHFKCNMDFEEEFKTMYRVGEDNDQHILNVYLCNYFALGRFGQFGEATYPLDSDAHADKLWRDGVMLMNPTLPKSGNTMLMGQNILVHEVGHWLGLYHTWQGGCDDHPETGGDFVADTPAHDGPTKIRPGGKQCWLGLDTGPVDTCVDNTEGANNTGLEDPVSNYMNYVIYRDGDPGECYDEHGHFTPGQVQRMVEQYEQYRLQPPEEIIQQPATGGGFGDPHFKTWRGHRFEFHGECDLVLAQSSAFDNGMGLDVHIRTTMTDNWSYISAAAIRIGTDIFEMDSHGMYYLNGKPGVTMPNAISGFKIIHRVSDTKQNFFSIDLGVFKGRIEFQEFKDFAMVRLINGVAEHFADSTGMMGSYEKGTMLARDGKTVIADANKFGLEWQVRDSEIKLFQDIQRAPQYPARCIMPTEAHLERRRLSQTDINWEAAHKACSHLAEMGAREACVYDVLATGDLEMANAGAF